MGRKTYLDDRAAEIVDRVRRENLDETWSDSDVIRWMDTEIRGTKARRAEPR